MSIKQQIESLLTAQFSPQLLKIIDDSEQHRGHDGYKEGGETHFTVRIISQNFKGLSRIERHKLIHKCLEALLKDHIHALSIHAYTLEELTQ